MRRQRGEGGASGGRRFGGATRRRLGLALLLPWLVFALPGAASATGEAGAGAGLGDETDFQTNPANPPPRLPLCLEVAQSEYVVTATGTVTANDGAVIYQGSDIIVTMTPTETYYVAPEGTYGARPPDGSCDSTTFGREGHIAATVTVNATGGTDSGVGTGANVANPACSGTGEYFRLNTNVTFTWRAATCDVNGNGANGAFEEVNTDFVFEGSLRPCTPLPSDPCVGTVQGSYSQDSVVPSPAPPPEDPQDGCPSPTIVEGPMGPELAPDECTDSAGFADDIDESQSHLQSPPEPSSAQDMWGPSTDTMSTTLIDQGFETGGCTANGTCVNLEVFWLRSKGFQRKTAKGLRLYHGLQINAWLRPPEEDIAPGWYYDFLVQETSVTNDFGRVCVVRNAVKNPEGNPNVLSKWPGTVHQSVTNGDTKTLSIGASLNAGPGTVNASYSTTFPVATGKIYGDYDFTKSAFFGAWRVPNLASRCDKSGGQQIASGIAYAYNTPVPPHRRYTFGGLVASQAIKGPALRSQAIPVVEHEDG